jgi:hypothetical protein
MFLNLYFITVFVHFDIYLHNTFKRILYIQKVKDSVFLRYDVMSLGNQFPLFWDKTVASFSRAEEVKGIYDYIVLRRFQRSYTECGHILLSSCCVQFVAITQFSYFFFFKSIYRVATWCLIKNTQMGPQYIWVILLLSLNCETYTSHFHFTSQQCGMFSYNDCWLLVESIIVHVLYKKIYNHSNYRSVIRMKLYNSRLYVFLSFSLYIHIYGINKINIFHYFQKQKFWISAELYTKSGPYQYSLFLKDNEI